MYAVLGKLGRLHPPLVTGDMGLVKDTFGAVVSNVSERYNTCVRNQIHLWIFDICQEDLKSVLMNALCKGFGGVMRQ